MNTTILHWLSDWGVPVFAHEYLYWTITLSCVVLVIYMVNLIFRRVLSPAIRKVTNKTTFEWDEIVLSDSMLKDISRLIPPILLAVLLPIVFVEGSDVLDFVMRINNIYLVVVVAKLFCTFLASLYNLSLHHERLKNHSLQSVYQMLKVLVVCVALIIVVSILINKNPGYILTALGASAAVLMLVFKDMIVGLVAGVQLSVNDMLRPGDWIAMPKYGADGDVIEVSLTTVKVQNWDKTITTIPPYALVSDSFQNWRGMQESGGRRVKRSVYIDMRSIQFCTEEQIKEFESKGWLEGIERADDRPVNLHVFRNYLEKYLRNHPRVNQDMTIMVRQLQPTVEGLPLELYFFSAGTAWIQYEQLQSEIFEHLFAILPTFGIRIFQSPMGSDLVGVSLNIN
ncbi:MAG: mechanosensitive ion channel [Paludibacteraceae bacterium]|nr:mechanosensitive ion channel [Paludibacteraceae bacterium]